MSSRNIYRREKGGWGGWERGGEGRVRALEAKVP